MANEPASNGCVTIEGLATKFRSEEALKFAKKLYIHGGNISNWNRIKRKTTPSSADEVSDSFLSAVLWFIRNAVLVAIQNCCLVKKPHLYCNRN